IISRGFVFSPDGEHEILENARQRVREVVAQSRNGNTENIVQDALSKLFFGETGRRPLVFVFVNEV
ncbi:MAG TPA: hypothetical protein PLD47_18255, partial [Aggregatilineales bacterium]|nr:hypothetical protein [Aggregatilineales bacterium]